MWNNRFVVDRWFVLRCGLSQIFPNIKKECPNHYSVLKGEKKIWDSGHWFEWVQ